MKLRIIGAGLAGSEAAWQAAERGVSVELFEMRPTSSTKAHKSKYCAELVCSNSFRGAGLHNAVGLLKEELKVWGSLIMQAALANEVPAGGALAVDRDGFSQYVHQKISEHPLIELHTAEISSLPDYTPDAPLIIASGPLTSLALTKEIEKLTSQDNLAFYDAISPIFLHDSIDHSKIFRQSRYDKGEGDDYLNIPLTEEAYYSFVENILAAEKYTGNLAVEHEKIENLRPFEGCMPIEDMAERGKDTMLFGPLKPVGLTDPKTGRRPYGVVQLRQDDTEGSLWSMVGLQTRMKRHEQDRVFRELPGLEKVEFVRYGSVHRNTFIDSPKCLEATLCFREAPGLFFAGQITGTEGYVESTAGGMLAGINAARMLREQSLLQFPQETAIGALMAYISDTERKDFQPMNISYGLMPSYLDSPRRDGKRKLSKKERRIIAAEHALDISRTLYKDEDSSLDLGNSSKALKQSNQYRQLARTSTSYFRNFRPI